jgi:hypothetical protein
MEQDFGTRCSISSAVIQRTMSRHSSVRRPDREARPASHSLNRTSFAPAEGSSRARINNRDQPTCSAPSNSVSELKGPCTRLGLSRAIRSTP